MTLNKPRFRFILDIRFAQHQPRMPLGRRNLTGQVEQPHKLARPPPILLVFPIILVRLDWWLADDGCQFGSYSFKCARWSQHAEMRDAQRTIRMIGV